MNAKSADKICTALAEPMELYELARMLDLSPFVLSLCLMELERDGRVRRQGEKYVATAKPVADSDLDPERWDGLS